MPLDGGKVSGVSREHGLRGLFNCLPQVGGEDHLTLQLAAAWHGVLDLLESPHESSLKDIKGPI